MDIEIKQINLDDYDSYINHIDTNISFENYKYFIERTY